MTSSRAALRRNILRLISATSLLPLYAPFARALSAGAPSRTAQSTAMHRAAHQLFDAPLVFDDLLAVRILGPVRRRWLLRNAARFHTGRARAMRAFLVTRSRYAEDELARACAAGVRQYVVLGAGLDTFGCRERNDGDLRVFEVDHPATQDWKRAHLQATGIEAPSSLVFVPVDFEKDDLGARLEDAGLDHGAPVFVSWLGVTMYLTRESVMQTLRYVAQSCASGSTIVFDFSVPADTLDERERASRTAAAARVARIGEPWISEFDPDAFARELRTLGFSEATSFGAAEANARYFSGRGDTLRFRGSARIMMARV